METLTLSTYCTSLRILLSGIIASQVFLRGFPYYIPSKLPLLNASRLLQSFPNGNDPPPSVLAIHPCVTGPRPRKYYTVFSEKLFALDLLQINQGTKKVLYFRPDDGMNASP